jgi:hypothetical protein
LSLYIQMFIFPFDTEPVYEKQWRVCSDPFIYTFFLLSMT